MKKFRELGVTTSQRMIGDKIKINKVLNREIVVHSSRIEDSKYPKNKSGKCLALQIEIDNEMHVIFTGSDVLIESVTQIQKEDYPFATTIVKSGEYFQFT